MGLKPIIITCREYDVLIRLCKPNNIIAEELGISEGTLNTYYYRLSAKLNAETRTEIAVKAIQKGIVNEFDFIT